MGLLDTWRQVRQDIIDSKPTYTPFITPQKYVSPFYTDEVVREGEAPLNVVREGETIEPRKLPYLVNDTSMDHPMEEPNTGPFTTDDLKSAMNLNPIFTALNPIPGAGLLIGGLQRSAVKDMANTMLGHNMKGGPLTWSDMLPFIGTDWEARINEALEAGERNNPASPAYPFAGKAQGTGLLTKGGVPVPLSDEPFDWDSKFDFDTSDMLDYDYTGGYEGDEGEVSFW